MTLTVQTLAGSEAQEAGPNLFKHLGFTGLLLKLQALPERFIVVKFQGGKPQHQHQN